MAKSVLAQLNGDLGSQKITLVPLLGENDEITLGGPQSTLVETQAVEDADLAWLVGVHGAYVYQFQVDRHLSGPVLEVGTALDGGRFMVGATAAYFVGSEADIDGVSVGLDCLEFLAVARMSFGSGTLFTRLGVGGGWQRQELNVNSAGRQDQDVTAVSDVATLALDLEGGWRFAPHWHLGLTIGPRMYLGGVAHFWLGEPIYGDVPGAFSGQLGLGYAL